MPDVAAVIVTRGNVDLDRCIAAIPEAWELVIWDNSKRPVDLSVYGRFAAIADTEADWIYVQDDDVVVSDPAALVAALGGQRDAVLCNMPAAWRAQEFYERHALVGFGAAFHRDLPARAFERMGRNMLSRGETGDLNRRCCDVIFTALVDRYVVDLPYENLPWATGDDRMYRRPEHFGERKRMLERVLQVADQAAAA